MSFHGGFIGVLLAMWLYGRRIKQPFFVVVDFVAPWTPIGLFAGRIGNFINGELWEKPTSPDALRRRAVHRRVRAGAGG